jgi:hypothetical protein
MECSVITFTRNRQVIVIVTNLQAEVDGHPLQAMYLSDKTTEGGFSQVVLPLHYFHGQLLNTNQWSIMK